MPSLRAWLVSLHLKRTVKSKPLQDYDVRVLREQTDAVGPKRLPKGVIAESVNTGQVKGVWHKPKKRSDENNAPVILFMHGGGYAFGSSKSHAGLTCALALECNASVFSLDYRMAPEAPFPAAVDDAVSTYCWLLAQRINPERIVLSGDSAGGGLALALLLSIKEQDLPMPAGAVLYSPWTDLTVTGGSIESNQKSEAMFQKIHITEGAKRYLNGADPKTPTASPLYGDLAGLPPMIIFVSNSEVLRDDSIRLHERLIDLNVDADMIVEEGLPHDWPVFVGSLPEARRTISQSAAFIKKITGT
ncbi:MAG: hypothetical protein DHS20C05_09270 [Hyphococcus sp.]|nr:MAG: hypothetical protein DHS20C05_09270 [Marinicaulis sp.]